MIPRQKQNRPDGNQGGSAKVVTSSITQECDQLPRLTGCPMGCPLDHHEHELPPKSDSYTPMQKRWILDLMTTYSLDPRGRYTMNSEVKI